MKRILYLLLLLALLSACKSTNDNSKLMNEAEKSLLDELKASSQYPESIKIESKEVTFEADSICIIKTVVIANDSPSHSVKHNIECAYVIAEAETFALITNLDRKSDIITQQKEHNATLREKLEAEGLPTDIAQDINPQDPRYGWFLRSYCSQTFHLLRIKKTFQGLDYEDKPL